MSPEEKSAACNPIPGKAYIVERITKPFTFPEGLSGIRGTVAVAEGNELFSFTIANNIITFNTVSGEKPFTITITNQTVVTFGRSQGNLLVLDSTFASRNHGVITFGNNSINFGDQGSTHGTSVKFTFDAPSPKAETFANGQEITLASNSIVSIGHKGQLDLILSTEDGEPYLFVLNEKRKYYFSGIRGQFSYIGIYRTPEGLYSIGSAGGEIQVGKIEFTDDPYVLKIIHESKEKRIEFTPMKFSSVPEQGDLITTEIIEARIETPALRKTRYGMLVIGTNEAIDTDQNNQDGAAIVVHPGFERVTLYDELGGYRRNGEIKGLAIQILLNQNEPITPQYYQYLVSKGIRMIDQRQGAIGYLFADIYGSCAILSGAGDVQGALYTHTGRLVYVTPIDRDGSEQNVLSNSISGKDPGSTWSTTLELFPGAILVCASDGLWAHYTPEEVGHIIAGHSLKDAMSELDDVTVQAMRESQNSDDRVFFLYQHLPQ